MNEHVEPTMARILNSVAGAAGMREEPDTDEADIEADARSEERRESRVQEREARIERSLWGNQE